MALFKSGNPALSKDAFTRINYVSASSETMTISGTINKVALMLLLVIASAALSWNYFLNTQNIQVIGIYIFGGSIAGIILAMIIVFKKHLAPTLAPIYALFEGLALGGISVLFEMNQNGIVTQAILLTFAIFAALLLIYKMRLIKVTENFKLMVGAATGGIFLFYMLSFILGFFGIKIPMIHEGGKFGIIFSFVIIGIASMNLVVDFDFIEEGAEKGAPKYMEWYGAFGLIVTLIWLYLEILRLLSKLNRN